MATVSTGGDVAGLSPGAATVTATSEGKSGSAQITVSPIPVATVEVTPPTLNLIVQQTGNLTATLKDGAGNLLTGRPVLWGSSNKAVATVTATGVVSAVTPGTATVTATSEGKSGSAQVTALGPVATITVTLNKGSLEPTMTTQATAVLKDAGGNVISGRPVAWQTGSGQVAAVSSTGLVTAVAPGQTFVRAVSDAVNGQASLTVVQPMVGTVTVTPPTVDLFTGQTKALTVELRTPAGLPIARPILWTSSAPLIATVSGAGVVTAVAIGTARIVATADLKADTSLVTVRPFSFGTGTRIVGVEVPPGTYRSTNPTTASCYWARLSNFTGTDDIIANDIGGGPRVVEIIATDVGFRSSRCGAWIQVFGPVTASPTAAFDDGVFIVGSDVASGTWRSSGIGTSCYWARLRNFTGTDDIIANDYGPSPAIVTIAATDIGFESARCGLWKKL